jgi:hypothetical protein
MKPTLTRREAGLFVMAASALRAQNAEQPADPVAAVAEGRRHQAEQLAKFKLPLTTEPAFEFRP